MFSDTLSLLRLDGPPCMSISAELEAVGPGINVAPLVGHAAIRSSVMGFEKRQATVRERMLMKALLRD